MSVIHSMATNGSNRSEALTCRREKGEDLACRHNQFGAIRLRVRELMRVQTLSERASRPEQEGRRIDASSSLLSITSGERDCRASSQNFASSIFGNAIVFLSGIALSR